MPGGFRLGFGRGHGQRGGGRGRGRSRGRIGNIPENCICSRCGTIVPHQIGLPCFQTVCPNCSSTMTRQFNVPGLNNPAQPAATAQNPEINPEICTGCQKCITGCPQHAIEMKDNKAFILPEKCTNCRLCIPVCPVSAIA